MANDVHLRILKQGVSAWNQWRSENPSVVPDLSDANLIYTDLAGANLNEAYLRKAQLIKGNLNGACLISADLRWANLGGATLTGEAKLMHADLVDAHMVEAELVGADLSDANLSGADLRRAKLQGATLDKVDLSGANLGGTELQKAVLIDADLRFARLVSTVMENATLTGCRVYGISAWDLKLEGANQSGLVITRDGEPTITVDDLEVAQFIYLLLNNAKLRNVIDTVSRKAVLILGNFSPERKAILDAIRDTLRRRGYLPILFDFDKPLTKSTTETVAILSRLARFIIADLTEPKSISGELANFVPTTLTPVKPLLKNSERAFSMYADLPAMYHWVLPIQRYEDRDDLIASFDDRVIAPAEQKLRELAPDKARTLTESWLSEETEAR